MRFVRRLLGRDPESVPGAPVAGCGHLHDAPAPGDAPPGDGCEQCKRDGKPWVHLRMCLTCGNVACCDSGAAHATAHFRESGHPVMRSVEPGESWRWCYVDEQLG